MTASPNPDRQTQIQNPTLFDRFFRDQDGRIVIAQPPNLPVLTGITALLLRLLLATGGTMQTGLELIAFGAGFTWAWEELFQGVNYFRRSLGLLGLGSVLVLGVKFFYPV